VGKLPKQTTDNDLIKTFRFFGNVKSAYVIKDSRTEKSLNFGYVVFKKLESARKAVECRNIQVLGKKISCKPYRSKMEVESHRNKPHQSEPKFRSKTSIVFSDEREQNPTSFKTESRVRLDFDSGNSSRAKKMKEIINAIPRHYRRGVQSNPPYVEAHYLGGINSVSQPEVQRRGGQPFINLRFKQVQDMIQDYQNFRYKF
jgi:RNA recognition motif-containing protein